MTRWAKTILAGLAVLTTPLCAATSLDECQTLRRHGQRDQEKACFENLSRQKDSYLQAEGLWGIGNFQEANQAFRILVAQSPKNANYRVRWGMLLHDQFNNADAQGLFQEAIKLDPMNAKAYLGLAQVSADGFDGKADVWAKKALELDPKLVAAHELLANLALEDSQKEAAAKEADTALQLSSEALDAMAIHAAIDVLADRPPDAWLAKVTAVNPRYGDAPALIAHHLVLNRRYEDGVKFLRQATKLDPMLWSAHSELGINLMRLGQPEEARKELELSYNNGYRNSATVNSLRLLDSYKNFITFKEDGQVLILHKKEAEVLRPYFAAEVKRSIATYEKKYKMKLPGPVQIEVYPDHEDFAVRTMGMPGLGALGVTFVETIAMDSPSGRKPGDFHWASTLWHEMSHVFILQATNQRVPRWFTEGLAVHEETEASPEWGDRVTPDVLVAIRDKKLLPIADMDKGFIHPDYPSQVIVSYYQAGRICDYIKMRWGSDKLLDMVHSFAELKSTPETIQRTLGMKPEDFDKQFMEWLMSQQDGKSAANFNEWRTTLKALAQAAKEKKMDEVLRLGEQARKLYPEYVYEANPYEFLAEAYLAKDNKASAMEILAAYEKLGGRDPDALKRLAGLQEETGNKQAAAATLDRINFIYPVNNEELHRHLGDLYFAQENYHGAIREYGSVLASQPLDKASGQFKLAQAYAAAGQKEKAEQYVLEALETAPGYRPAQQLLLQLEDSKKGK